ncbi:TIR domain-containing protein [Segetibacter sp. 3557_3]|uniref:CD225/dispanin family protein n=1 Tax=Segetibacter sp. 3557_3 TaxID=2547429 RepID=UPI0010587292|nr:CD225/dispanin family protein [Segetibacter sp. 3557_3]TDH21433.1 TIR domain-containing protein [Segetibacter sp. 3557_3]
MNIFISYRRHDTAGEAGRLVDSLKQHFSDEEIFIDIDTIQPGLDFTEVISESLKKCDVLLALIGPEWLASNAEGKRRIDNPDDFIRLEIAEALKRNIRVIPVLVDNAELPEAADLPADLKGLIRRQAYEVSNKRWKFDVEELVKSLKKGQSYTGSERSAASANTPPIPAQPVVGSTTTQVPPQPQNPTPPINQVHASPKNWLTESILSTLFCCLPFGIVGIINAAKVNNLYAAGDYNGALKASQDAAKWTKIAVVSGIVVYGLYFLLVLVLGDFSGY